jgi:hypothetical protein
MAKRAYRRACFPSEVTLSLSQVTQLADTVAFGGIALAQNHSAKKHLVLSQAVKAGGMIAKSSGERN